MLSVTSALTLAGLCDPIPDPPPDYLDHALKRGQAVHATIALDVQCPIADCRVHHEVAPYLASWRQWATSVGYVHRESEQEVKGYGYIGHFDLLGDVLAVTTLIDLKCGPPEPSHCLQTAGYVAAKGGRLQRGCVYLSGDGKPATWIAHTNPADFATFAAVVRVASWKKANIK